MWCRAKETKTSLCEDGASFSHHSQDTSTELQLNADDVNVRMLNAQLEIAAEGG